MTKNTFKQNFLRRKGFVLTASVATAISILGIGLILINNNRQDGTAFASFDNALLQVRQVIGVSPDNTNLIGPTPTNDNRDVLAGPVGPNQDTVVGTPVTGPVNPTKPSDTPTKEPLNTPVSNETKSPATTVETTTRPVTTQPQTPVTTPSKEVEPITIITIENCVNVGNNLSLATVTYEKTVKLFQEKYDNLDSKLTKLIGQSELEKKDVKSLKEISQKLQTEISLFRSNSQLFLGSLNEARAGVCTKKTTDFGQILIKSRDILSLLSNNATKIDSLLQKSLKDELQKFN